MGFSLTIDRTLPAWYRCPADGQEAARRPARSVILLWSVFMVNMKRILSRSATAVFPDGS